MKSRNSKPGETPGTDEEKPGEKDPNGWDQNKQNQNDPASPLDLQKLKQAKQQAIYVMALEETPKRLKIRIEVILEKMEREHPTDQYKRWEAHFYTRILNEAVSEALGGIEQVSRTVLREAIDWALKYAGEPSVDREVAYGEFILLKPDATQEEIDGAADRIITAIREHEKIQMSQNIKEELKSLEEIILIAQNYEEHRDISISLSIAIEVRDRAQQGEISLELIEEIKAAKDALIQALSQALAPVQDSDKEALEGALAKAADRQTKDKEGKIRIPSTLKENLQEVIQEGHATLNDKRALKYDYTIVIEKILSIVVIIDDLPTIESLHTLEDLMEKAEALLNGEPLSFISKAKIHAALGVANYTVADYLATDEDYIQAIHQLKEAIAGAEPADPNTPGSEEDVEELRKAVEDAKKMQEREGLSHEDHRILQEEIDKAEEILKQEKPKKIEVQRATEALRAAIANAMPVKAPEPTQKQKDQLRELVNEAKKALEREGISFEDVRTLNGAIENGTQILSKQDATRDDYDKAIERLRDALNKTKPINPIGPKPDEEPADAVDRGLLNQAMEKLMAEKNKVIKDDRDRIDGAVRDARFVRDDEYATKQDIKDQIEYLNKMKEGLTYLATEEQLKKLHELVRKANLQINRLSPEESQGLRDETNIAEIFLEATGEKTAAAAEERYKKLDAEFRKTVKNATDEHKKELQDKLNELAKDKELLSPEDQKELQDVLDRGNKVATDDLATDIEVEDMLDELKQWEEKTKLAASKKELKEAIAKAKEAINKNPKVNKDRLEQAIKYAEQVLEKDDANQTTIDEAAQGLEKAMQEFNESVAEKEAADEAKKDLLAKINEAKAKKKEQISQASKDRLTKAIEDGERVYNDHETIESVVRDAIKDLEVAMERVEPLATEAQIEALRSKIREANPIINNKKEVLSPMQYNELERAFQHAAAEIQKHEKLEKNIVEATNRIDTVIQQLVYLATDSHFDILERKINSLQIIRDLYDEFDPAALELQPVLNEARAVLAKKDLSERASEAEVMGQVTIIDEWLEKYKDALNERWEEEKALLDRYITHITDVILKDGFAWGNANQDKPRVQAAKDEAEQLKKRAEGDEKDKVKLDELIKQNEKLSAIINEVDRMTKKDYTDLLASQKDIDAAYNNALDDNLYDKAKEIKPLLDKVNEELAKVTDPDAESFTWPGMDRLKYKALLDEIKDAPLT